MSAQNWTNSSSTDVDLVSNWSSTVTRSSATSSSFREGRKTLADKIVSHFFDFFPSFNETEKCFWLTVNVFVERWTRNKPSLLVPLVFSIISFTVRPSRLADGHFYSVDVLLNSTCPSRRHSNVTLLFQSSTSQLCSNEQTAQGIITCDRLIFGKKLFIRQRERLLMDAGARYVIDGYLLCQTQNVTLNKTEQLYRNDERDRSLEVKGCFLLDLAEPKYLNSTRSITTIDSFFYLPGFFSQLIVQLTNINRTCSIEYSPTSSPFYHCLFRDLPTAQWFILNYYLLTTDQQSSAGDVTIVHTGRAMEMRCWDEVFRWF